MIDWKWDSFSTDENECLHRAIANWMSEDATIMRLDPTCDGRYVKEGCFRGTISRAGRPFNSEKNGVALTLTEYVGTGTIVEASDGFALEHGDLIISAGPNDGCREMRLIVEAVIHTNTLGVTVTLTRVA